MKAPGLPPETVASLRELILKPVAVYESATERDSIVVVTIEMPDGINPLIVAIRIDVPDSANKPNMHWMVSAYAKDDPAIVKRWEANGPLIWKREPVVSPTPSQSPQHQRSPPRLQSTRPASHGQTCALTRLSPSRHPRCLSPHPPPRQSNHPPSRHVPPRSPPHPPPPG